MLYDLQFALTSWATIVSVNKHI